jgi:hypothetical protein
MHANFVQHLNPGIEIYQPEAAIGMILGISALLRQRTNGDEEFAAEFTGAETGIGKP